jgi:hypothetical protein
MKSKDKLDKDRFRRDLGGLIEAYSEVARRLGILGENENPASAVRGWFSSAFAPDLLGAVAHCFDVVAIRIARERAVIIPTVLRPEAGRAVVDGADLKRNLVETPHRGARLGRERHMHPRSVRADPKARPSLAAEAAGSRPSRVCSGVTSAISSAPSGVRISV